MPINSPNSSQRKKQLNDYARYSAIGLQIGAVIFLSVLGGKKLDQMFELKVPVFTLLLSLLSVTLSMVYFIRNFRKPE